MRVAELKALRPLLMLRERREELEEQRLGEMTRQMRQAKAAADAICVALSELREGGAAVLGTIWIGAEHQQRESEIRTLQQREVAAQEFWVGLEQRCAEQMRVYRAVHADREMVSSLMEKSRRAELAAMGLRERKAGEEMFLGRRVRMQQEELREMR